MSNDYIAVFYWLKKAMGKHAESLIELFAVKKGTAVELGNAQRL